MKTGFRLIIFLFAIFASTHSIGQYEWKWGRSVEGRVQAGMSEAWAIASDRFGHIYASGTTPRDTSIFGVDTFINDIHFFYTFLVKYDMAGNVLWAKKYNTGLEGITGMVADSSGNLYVVGSFNTCSMIIGTDTLRKPGCTGVHSDAINNFIAKFDSMGNPIWSKQLINGYYNPAIALDRSNNIYMTGSYGGVSATIDTFVLVNRDILGRSYDAYVVKMDNDGHVLWVKTAGGRDFSHVGAAGHDMSNSIATDAGGNVYITGEFSSDYFAIDSFSIYNSYYRDYYNKIFIAKMDATGRCLWVKSPTTVLTPLTMYFTGGETSTYIRVDNFGHFYITGGFGGLRIKFDSIVLENTHEDADDVFLAKYDSSGNVIWAKRFGSDYQEVGYSILIDSLSQQVWSSGFVGSDSVVFGSFTARGGTDVAYVMKCDTSGDVQYLTTLPGGGEDWQQLATDGYGNIYMCGDFEDSSLVVNRDTLYGDAENYFIAKLGRSAMLPELAAKHNAVAIELKLYPNPAKETITIKYDHSAAGALTITNMAGQIVHTQAFTGLSTISTAHYVPGIYMCRVVVDGRAMVSRFSVY